MYDNALKWMGKQGGILLKGEYGMAYLKRRGRAFYIH